MFSSLLAKSVSFPPASPLFSTMLEEIAYTLPISYSKISQAEAVNFTTS